MRTVIGYVDGRPQYRDEGPARARVAGYGGSAIGHTVTVVLTQRKAKGTATAEAAKRHRRSV